ncbi:MAG: hypothetical protein S4CHLAM37_08890 [Chlamydiia bacterium]|nr:hypothetical protein [Chlamydiia bacterium]
MMDKGLEVTSFDQAFERLRVLSVSSSNTQSAIKEFLEIHDADPALASIAIDEVYRNKSFKYDVLPTLGAKEVLMELARKHVLALVSVGIKEIQLKKMKKAGIDTALFSRIVVSESPDKKMYYKQLLEDLRVSPLEVLVCGDRVKRDLTPGKGLGFKTVHIKWGRGVHQKGSKSQVDFTITSLKELKPIIAQFEH